MLFRSYSCLEKKSYTEQQTRYSEDRGEREQRNVSPISFENRLHAAAAASFVTIMWLNIIFGLHILFYFMSVAYENIIKVIYTYMVDIRLYSLIWFFQVFSTKKMKFYQIKKKT